MKMLNSRALFITLSFSFLYCFGLIVSGRNYLDDYGRYIHGYTSWSSNGRPFAELIMSTINFGAPVVDISPLPLLLGITCLSIMGYAISYRFIDGASTAVIATISSLIIANPFLLENLSFKYDSLAMCLSMLVISIPFICSKNKRSLSIDFFITSACVFLSLGLYQSSIGIFVILAILECIHRALHGEDETKWIILYSAIRATQLLVGYAAYSFIIVRTFVNDEYTRSHSELIGLTIRGLKDAFSNASGYIALINSYIISLPKMLVVLYVLVIPMISVCCFFYIIKRRSSLSLASIALISPLLFVVFSFGHFLMLKEPVISSRVMTSFSATMISIAVMFCLVVRKNIYRFAFAAPVVICSLIISLSYSSASRAQNAKDDQVAQSIYLNASREIPSVKYVHFNGEIKFAEQRQIAISKFPVLSDILKSYISKDQFWSAYMLTNNGVHVNAINLSRKDIDKICSTPPIIKTTDYVIHSSNETMVISFNQECN